MDSVQEIMERAEADGRDPDEELRDVISRTVLARGHDTAGSTGAVDDSSQPKRQRLDEGNS